MKKVVKTFGQLITDARKQTGMNLTECAARIFKEDGTSVSVQYLSDLEKDRRNPPSEKILKQLAVLNKIPIEVLYYYAETFPSGLNKNVTEKQIVEAFQAFYEKLGQKLR